MKLFFFGLEVEQVCELQLQQKGKTKNDASSLGQIHP